MPPELTTKKEYLLNLISAIEQMDPNPFSFLCASTMIEYLIKLKGYSGKRDYIKFVRHYFGHTYNDFAYASGSKDLPEQMYFTLRCGLVHNFSLIPGQQERNNGARERSILIAHRSSADGKAHLSRVASFKSTTVDAALFVLEDFCGDLALATEKIFAEAQQIPQNTLILEKRWTDFPPVSADV